MLKRTNFVKSKSDENEYNIIDKDVVIFSKNIENDKVKVCLHGVHKFEDYSPNITE